MPRSAAPPFTVRALGEIAIRCADKPAMVAFYRDVIGLQPMTGAEASITFLRISEGIGGHTCVLALFDHLIGGAGGVAEAQVTPQAGAASTLHHIALSLYWEEQEAVIGWYERLGRAYRVEDFDWIGWRGGFTTDPDGNTVELVARDPGWTRPTGG